MICPLCSQRVEVIDGKYANHSARAKRSGRTWTCAMTNEPVKETPKEDGHSVFARIRLNNGDPEAMWR